MFRIFSHKSILRVLNYYLTHTCDKFVYGKKTKIRYMCELNYDWVGTIVPQ